MSQFFHLTLGPVQSFVAQARRTRDFWAGSFMLSWLSGVAMTAVKQQKGEINFPLPDEDFLKALQGEATSSVPLQGSLPNRFKALGAEVQPGFDALAVVNTLQQVWQALADHIWQQDLELFLHECGEEQYQRTRAIWKRQAENLWEINWVLTEDATASHLLDRRKNWRQQLPPDEPGVKCMMMSGLQELSGQASPNRQSMAPFWDGLRNELGNGLDLRENECLSAPALIKRRFARHFASFAVTLNNQYGEQHYQGWKLPANVPSTSYLAALPWIFKAVARAQQDENIHHALEQMLLQARELLGESELHNAVPKLRKAMVTAGFQHQLAGVDGGSFFINQLDYPNYFGSDSEQDATPLLQAFNALKKQLGAGEPAPFYALLMMDGDSLGSQMSDTNKQKYISAALNNFTKGVAEHVVEHNGFLVYAGGDDVLAMLPIDTVLPCALALRNFYAKCFADQNQLAGEKCNILSSLSGAIEFAHVKRPLTSVLHDAHQLLDDIAKDATGRDALAIRVWQPGGMHLEWSQPWAAMIENDSLVLLSLAKQFRNREQESAFTNKFLFKAMELIQRLPSLLQSSQKDLLQQLLLAELLHSGLVLSRNAQQQEPLQLLLRQLIDQAKIRTRKIDDNGVSTIHDSDLLNPDTFKLVRFL